MTDTSGMTREDMIKAAFTPGTTMEQKADDIADGRFPGSQVRLGPGIVVPTQERFLDTMTTTIRHGGLVWREHEQSHAWFLERVSDLVYEREIPVERRPWRPFALTTPVRPDGSVDEAVANAKETFLSNSHYLVFVRVIDPEDPYDADKLDPQLPEIEGQPSMVHLSMRTVENDVRHDWREMQRVKNEILGPEWEGMELYPAESRVVDTANQYHLWCLPFTLPFGWHSGLRGDQFADVVGGAQRPLS